MNKHNEKIERYLSNALMDVTDKINERVREFYKSYKEMKFGKRFFLDILVRNVTSDLEYFRDSHLKAHLLLCKQNSISDDNFAVEHALAYMKRLENLHGVSFIHFIKMVDPWFPLSKKERKKRSDQMTKLVNEVLDEMKTK